MPLIADIIPLEQRKEALKAEIVEHGREIERLIHDNTTRAQDQARYIQQYNNLAALLEQKQAEVASVEHQISDLLTRKQNVHIFLEGLRKGGNMISRFDIPTWHALVEYATVMANDTIVFQMRNGSTITVPIETIKCRP